MQQVVIDHLLPRVEKPSRYINNEINSIHKSPSGASFKACMAFPDLYELGVSHLGLKILYSLINRLEWAMADRVYLPWLDMIKLMREEKIPLWGLESQLPLKAFDLIGITLQSELNFSNVPELLDLGEIPVLRGKRNQDAPIVMAGGPCATNPLPLVDFIDVFFLGEAEEAILEIAKIFRSVPGREERLKGLAALESCYVPSIHGIPSSEPIKVRKYMGFSEGTHIHSPQLMSWQLATHNRYVAEIMRGCSRGCRFCHAGYFYRPVRERNADQILQQLLIETRQSGWDEAGLISLSSSDYSCIKPLLLNLLNALDTNQTHVSLPSLRVDSLDDELVSSLKALGREGLTIAPEAGSQRLRNVINKNLSEEEIIRGIEVALKLGWQKIKLYFMIGLPTETDEDVDAIVALINKIDSLARKRLQINVTLSPFVPKVFTPFQWEAFAPTEQVLERILRVKHSFGNKRNIKIKYHNLESSKLEAILSRGDRETSGLIYEAWKLGAKYDGWNEVFDFSLWEQAAANIQLDLSHYLQAGDPDTEPVWSFINTGVCQSFLLLERERALRAETTPDCRELCSVCGVCEGETFTVTAPPAQLNIAALVQEPVLSPSPQDLQNQFHYRAFYRKTGILRFISHLDWMRMLFRWVGSIPLELVFTQGFNPHPKVSLSPPLPVGVSGLNEYFDLSFFKPYNEDMVEHHFVALSIPGFEVFEVRKLSKRHGSEQPQLEVLNISFPSQYQEQIEQAARDFMRSREFIYTKQKGSTSKIYNLREIVQSMEMGEGSLELVKSLESPSLYSILEAILGLSRDLLYTFEIKRLSLEG
ncbi:MAG TPA: TIGR03960 family B12-binding radical SAM protein [Candidatus Cloacimonadota bacterium]|nr:TIGR03960 family B12-binding radical SAM protein [Candidatus Cloacimonadota bacterium]